MEYCKNKEETFVDIHSRNLNNKNDFDKILHKLKTMIDNVSPRKSKFLADSLIIETDFERDKFEDKIESHVPGQNEYGTFDDASDFDLCKKLAERIQQRLRNARDSDLKCEVLMPCDLTLKIAQDVIRMSHSEPCGLRGCVLYINLEEKSKCRQLTKLVYDPMTVSTFELYLTLKEDNQGWCTVQKMFYSISKCLKSTKRWDCSPKFLSPGFVLEKKKLYRSGSH